MLSRQLATSEKLHQLSDLGTSFGSGSREYLVLSEWLKGCFQCHVQNKRASLLSETVNRLVCLISELKLKAEKVTGLPFIVVLLLKKY